jgi:hypothetical protein
VDKHATIILTARAAAPVIQEVEEVRGAVAVVADPEAAAVAVVEAEGKCRIKKHKK